MATLSHQELLEAGLTDWHDGPEGLQARYGTGDFAAGLRFVNAVGEAAEELAHHPDVTLTYPQVGITLISHDVGGITERDVELARRISAIAAEHAIPAEADA